MFSQIGADKDKILEAKLDNVKNISHVISAINFKNTGVCFISDCGIKIVVEDSKCAQANAFIGNDIFEEYKIANEDETTMFRVDLSILVDCLTIFDGYCTSAGATTALKMTYEKNGSPLRIILEEDDIITDCSLKTMSDCDTLDLDVSDSKLICKAILKACNFKEVLADLDYTSEFVEFFVSPNPPLLRVTTDGLAGKFESNIPQASSIMESFHCTDIIKARYRYSQIKPCLKSLKIATKVSIRITEESLICLQFMIPTESKQNCYVEYYCIPCTDDA